MAIGTVHRSLKGRISDSKLPPGRSERAPKRYWRTSESLENLQAPNTQPGNEADQIFIITETIPNIYKNKEYSFFIQWTSLYGSVEPEFYSENLPTGIRLSREGELYGICTDTVAEILITVKVSDQNDPNVVTEYRDYALEIVAEPTAAPGNLVITTTSLPVAYENQVYGFQFTGVSGDGGTLVWGVSGDPLPAGLSLSTGGFFGGVPTEFGSFDITITLDDGINPQVTADFTLTVVEQQQGQIVITINNQLPNGKVGEAYVYQFESTGQTEAVRWTATNIPSGLSLSITGLLTGVPDDEYDDQMAVTAENDVDLPATKNFDIFISPESITLTLDPLSAIEAGEDLVVNWAVSPASLSFTPQWNFILYQNSVQLASFPITPTDLGGGDWTVTLPVPATVPAGNYVIAIVEGYSGTFAYTNLTINAYPTITISTSSLASGTVGVAYSASVAASGGLSALTYSATNLPAGLSCNAAGAISGSPTTAGNYSPTFYATDGITQDQKTIQIVINQATQLVFSNSNPLPEGTVGTAYSQNLAVTGAAGPVTFSLDAGALPTGLAVSGAGAITGTPSAAGTFTPTFRATDGIGTDAVQQFTMNVVTALGPGQALFTLLDGTQLVISEGADHAVTNGFAGNAYIQVAGPTTLSLASGTPGIVNAPAGSNGLHIRMTANELEIRNKGLRQGLNSAGAVTSGQPVYFQSLSANMPDRVIYLGELQGVVQTGDDFELIRLSDPKHPIRAGIVAPNYEPVGREHHFLDGGERIYYRFAPASDPTESSLFPSAGVRANAASIFNVNAARVAAWPFLEHCLELYQHDAATWSNTTYGFAPNAYSAKMTWIMRKDNALALATTNADLLADGNPYEKWNLGGLPFAPHDGAWGRPPLYATEAWYALDYLRNNSNTNSYVFGLYLMRRKIAASLHSSDNAPAKHKNRWGTEGTSSRNADAGAGYPRQACRHGQYNSGYYDPFWKAWSEGVAIYRILTNGNDPLINDAFDRCIDWISNVSLNWVSNSGDNPAAGGNLRGAGHVLMDAWVLYKACNILGGAYAATATTLFNKMEAFLETMFVAIDNCTGSPKPYWPPIANTTAQLPMGGSSPISVGTLGGLRALELFYVAATKWIGTAGTNPGRLAHWKLMVKWALENCTGVSPITGFTGGIRRSWCYEFAPNYPLGAAGWNGAPATVTFNQGVSAPDVSNGMYGCWVLALEPYMTSWYPGAVAPGGITWATYMDQMARFCFEWNDWSGNRLQISNTGPVITGQGSYGKASWSGKITGQFGYAACDW